LTLLVRYCDNDNILSWASFLRAAPLIEELEMHFDVHFVGFGWGNFKILPPCLYNYLRKVHFTGFNGIKGATRIPITYSGKCPCTEGFNYRSKEEVGSL